MKKLFFALSILFLMHSSAYAETSFSDVSSHWAKDTIKWALEKGIVSGYPNGTFQPNKKVNEAEFLTMLIRAYRNSSIVNIDEINKKKWPEGYYDFAVNKMNWITSRTTTVVQGKTEQYYAWPYGYEYAYPFGVYGYNKDGDYTKLYVITNFFNRVHAATILANSFGVDVDNHKAIQYLLVHNLANGKVKGKSTILNFKEEDPLTRAEALQFIKNAMDRNSTDGQILKREESKDRSKFDQIYKELDDSYLNYVKDYGITDTMGRLELAEYRIAIVERKSGITHDYRYNRLLEAYHLIKNAKVVDGGKKVRVYISGKPLRDRESIWISSFDRTRGDTQKYFYSKQEVPKYVDFDIDPYFTISLSFDYDGQTGRIPISVVTYNSKTKKIIANGKNIEENVDLR